MKDKTTEKLVKGANFLVKSKIKKSAIILTILFSILGVICYGFFATIVSIICMFIPIIGQILLIFVDIHCIYFAITTIKDVIIDIIQIKSFGINITEAGIYGRGEIKNGGLFGKSTKRKSFCLTYDQITSAEIVGKQIIINTNVPAKKKGQTMLYTVPYIDNMEEILYIFNQQAAKVAPVVVADTEAKTETATDAE